MSGEFVIFVNMQMFSHLSTKVSLFSSLSWNCDETENLSSRKVLRRLTSKKIELLRNKI